MGRITQAQLRSMRGYKRLRYQVEMSAIAVPNRIQREFSVALPDQIWDIHIRTHEGRLYLTVVINLYRA